MASHAEVAITTMKRAMGLPWGAVAKHRQAAYNAKLDHTEENFLRHRRFGSKLNQIYGIEVRLQSQTHASYSIFVRQIPMLCSFFLFQQQHVIPSELFFVAEETWTVLNRE